MQVISEERDAQEANKLVGRTTEVVNAFSTAGASKALEFKQPELTRKNTQDISHLLN